MRRRDTNKILLITLIVLILITASLIIISALNSSNNLTDGEEDIDVEEELRYDNGEVSYYNYYDNGSLDIDVSKYVNLPENYLEYRITSDGQEEINVILDKIVENSEVEIPTTLLNGYYGDIYNNAKAGAELEGKTLDEYIKGIYGYDSYQKYVEANTKYFEEDIKEDLVYQALAKQFNIYITKSDVENYFSERLENGNTYESLIKLYGEKLMYKYTMQDKIEKALIQRLSR